MSLDLLSVFIGALGVIIGAIIGGFASYKGIKFQVQRMIDLEVQRLKWNRNADKLLELGEHVAKITALITINIDKKVDEIKNYEQYVSDIIEIWGAYIRWSHFKNLSRLLKKYEDRSKDEVLLGSILTEEEINNVKQEISDLAYKIQAEIDKILQV